MGSKTASKKSKGGSKSDSSRKSRSSSKSGSKSKKDKKDMKEDKGESATAGTSSSGVNLSASTEFEAGMLFSKFDQTGSGLLDKTAFVQLFKEVEAKKLAAGVTGGSVSAPGGPPPIPPSFMAGQLFEKYSTPDSAGERGMTVQDFERFVGERGVGGGSSKGVSFAGDTSLPVGFTAGQLFER
jgi:hypothetical protein